MSVSPIGWYFCLAINKRKIRTRATACRRGLGTRPPPVAEEGSGTRTKIRSIGRERRRPTETTIFSAGHFESLFLRQKIRQASACRIFLSKPQAWYIIAAQRAVHIISPFAAVTHHASACIYLRLDDIQHFVLMIYRNKLRMIYKASP